MSNQPYFNVNMVQQVGNPAANRQVDGTPVPMMAGVHGSQLASEIHGKYFEITKRKGLFVVGSLIAGVALPVNAATLVSKFTIWNPVGSNVDVELVEFTLGLTSATEVVNGVLVGVQTQVSANGGSPTSLTKLAPLNGYSDGTNNNKASVYSAATMTNAAVLPVYPLGINFDATSGAMSGINNYVFDGKLILPPDTIATFCTNIAAETAATCGLSWAEWPI